MQTESLADIFIEKYKLLEQATRSTFDLEQSESVSHFLRTKAKFRRYAEELQYCTEVRNLLQHRHKVAGTFAVEPSQEMVDFIDGLIAVVEDRKRCIDICTKADKVYARVPEDSILGAMAIMRKHHFTCVPILDDKRVIGVFDENALFNYIADREGQGVDQNLTFQGLGDYLSLDSRSGIAFVFVPRNLYVDELEDLFEEHSANGARVVAAFVTETGSRQQGLLGLITAWDLINNN